MRRIFVVRLFVTGLLIVLLIANLANAGEAIKIHKEQRIEGEVIDIKPVFVMGKGNIYLVLVRDKKGDDTMFMYFERPTFEKGQEIAFHDNTIEILK